MCINKLLGLLFILSQSGCQNVGVLTLTFQREKWRVRELARERGSPSRPRSGKTCSLFFQFCFPHPPQDVYLCFALRTECHKTCETGVGLGISHFLWCLKILSMVSGHKSLEPARLYLSDFTIFVAGMVSTWSSAGHPALSHGGLFPGWHLPGNWVLVLFCSSLRAIPVASSLLIVWIMENCTQNL